MSDGSRQGTVRLEDGSTKTFLPDGTEILTAPNGAQEVTAPDGTTTSVAVTANGKLIAGADGSMTQVTIDNAGAMDVAYQYAEEAGGIESLVANPDEGTIDVVLANGEAYNVKLEGDGSMVVENGTTREFGADGSVAGDVATTKNSDGSTEVASESGATSTISADGRTMTVESADGASAVSTKTSSGVTVVIDGVEYQYDYATAGVVGADAQN